MVKRRFVQHAGSWGLALALAGPPMAMAQSSGRFEFIRRETREASREATLAQYYPALELSDWHLAGPFDNRGRNQHDTIHPPELEVDLTATYDGRDAAPVRWQKIEDHGWTRLDLKRFGSEADNSEALAYLYRTIDVERDVDVDFEMGSDDGLKVWLNGRLLVDADVYRGLDVASHRVALPLRAGRNELLVKVTQGTGGWEFHMRPRYDSRLLARLDYHLELEFPTSAESRHYRLLSILEPDGVVLEVGGLAMMPDGRPIVTTRRGEVWIVDGADADPPFDCTFTRFAFGLHEPLGAMWQGGDGGGLLVAQRGEVTRLVDLDGDDRADRFETVCDQWGVSGNYHEFAFGPEFDGAGRLWVTLNLGFCGSLGKSIVPWRGWAITIDDDGGLTPVCGGLRSPNGLGRNAAGAMFYTDNQGDWVATSKLAHLRPGDWHGHPGGDRWYEVAGMDAPDGEADFAPPAVWFPYDRMGRSASDIVLDDTGGAFGPFEGQLFVGDQYSAEVMRVDLEMVKGAYQGACFPFRRGFDCGVNRLTFGPDGSMYAGMTNRGWWSFGTRPWGLQRVVYTGVLPFEILTMRVRRDGFVLTFTKPVDPESAADLDSYRIARFTHQRWEKYGSPEIDRADLVVRAVELGDDGRSVRLVAEGLRPGYVHELNAGGVKSEDGETLLHGEGYYTLNALPSADEERSIE